jgi:hypothetical protein
MAVSFPAKFGKPSAVYQVQATDPVLRSEMERGQKARNTFERARFNYVYQFHMTNEAALYFQSWWRHKIDNGATWFDMPVRSSSSTTTVEARPLQYVAAEPLGNNTHWVINITCETRTDTIPEEAALDTWLALP